MIAIPAAKLRGYAALTAALVWAAIGLHRPELVAVAAPFGLLLAVGLAATVPPRVDGRVCRATRSGRSRATTVTLETELSTRVADRGRARGRAARAGRAGLGTRRRGWCGCEPDVPAVVPVELVCARWGGYLAGGMTLRAPGPLGLDAVRAGRGRVGAACGCTRRSSGCGRCRGRRPPTSAPATTSPASAARGSSSPTCARTYRATGCGGSTGGSARAAAGCTSNEYHPERNADVVLFLDAFSDTRDGAGGTIDMTVRAAAALAAAYLRTRDRVGIVGFGGDHALGAAVVGDDAGLPHPRLA